ncbi:MAG: isoamylase early set domain-containing protein [Anaerolineae bacterium]|nr:isoamylase early set domain-containing protein [Anaerolineae bacterium]
MLEKEDLGNGRVRVTFRVSRHIWADHIALVGEFNDWDRRRHLMQQSSNDPDWHIALELEAGRCYRFRYLVDDANWLNDDHADRYDPNPYGEVDSVVCV